MHYPPATKARAVRIATIESVPAAADATGVSERAIAYWLRDANVADVAAYVVQRKLIAAATIANRLVEAADAVMTGITEGERAASQRAIAYGVMVDKMLLLSGQAPSSNGGRFGNREPELAELGREALRRLKEEG